MTLADLEAQAVSLRADHFRLAGWCLALCAAKHGIMDGELKDAFRERERCAERARRARRLYDYAVEHGLAAAMLWKLANT